MKIISNQVQLVATDLSNHLACGHVTTLDLEAARGLRTAPEWRAPDLVVIQELGERHEARYLEYLRAVLSEKGGTFEDLREIRDGRAAVAKTLECMRRGVDVIAQGSLAAGRWYGRADVLIKVALASEFGEWSYEVQDCKLSRETKATTILQLALYSALLCEAQKLQPESMHVVPPGPGNTFKLESYRIEEYAAYYRYVKLRLEKAVDAVANGDTYPEPVPHCDVCRWFAECDARRRADDHLSLVAGIRSQQRTQLEEWKTETVEKLAELPIPLKEKPLHGSRDGMVKVREQARIQVEGRREGKLLEEPLLPVAEGMGFCRLPEPAAGDVFVDLEGDPFAGENGFQYMFGMAYRDLASGELRYEKRWALSREQEKSGFEWLVDEIMRRRAADPKMHMYHFGAYEPGTLKRLMGMYATREDEIDRMLRAGVMVDLHQAFKQALRASVEEYSLKKLEAFYKFERKTPLAESKSAMRYVEHGLELGWDERELTEQIRAVMEGYNSEDCFSTAEMRDWLEEQRKELVDGGMEVKRFEDRPDAPPEELNEWQKRVAALAEKLTAGIPVDVMQRTAEQQARWLIAQLLDWHRREDKATWWEKFRLAAMDEQGLLDDRAGLAGMKFEKRLGVERGIPTDRYGYEKQETEARCDQDLYYPGEALQGERFGCVVAMDAVSRTVDVKKTRKTAELNPTATFVWERPYPSEKQADALFRIGEWVAENGIDAAGKCRAGRDLLLRLPPRLRENEKLDPRAGETTYNTATRVVMALDDSVFAIQGPPGAGKTYNGARMICELVRQGKKVGVSALSHKVIRNLLKAVVEASVEKGVSTVGCAHLQKGGEAEEGIAVLQDNDEAMEALHSAKFNVLGATSYLWAGEPAFECVDVMFIDEAGQMSVADVLGVSQAARRLVLLGDPQQLERPLKGSHPDGAEKSALEHLLGPHKTIPPDMGFLLPETWRLHPEICKFTSTVFYEGKLGSHPTARARVVDGHPWLDGAGLWFMPVEHAGNRNSSAEEVEVIAGIVGSLLKPGVRWYRSAGNIRDLKVDDILIVAPYNAQVADLGARLPGMRIGTVDKFQGQEAPVVIYSLTTSTPEDAPRGMEFLYSLNRLNVATSRAMSTVIVVGSPKLLEPDCKSPRQMQLANALCRYREIATVVNERGEKAAVQYRLF